MYAQQDERERTDGGEEKGAGISVKFELIKFHHITHTRILRGERKNANNNMPITIDASAAVNKQESYKKNNTIQLGVLRKRAKNPNKCIKKQERPK